VQGRHSVVLQTKQNQHQAKRDILENIEIQGIRKMRPEREILKNGEYAEFCKIQRQETKMHHTRITHRSRQNKESPKNKELRTKRAKARDPRPLGTPRRKSS